MNVIHQTHFRLQKNINRIHCELGLRTLEPALRLFLLIRHEACQAILILRLETLSRHYWIRGTLHSPTTCLASLGGGRAYSHQIHFPRPKNAKLCFADCPSSTIYFDQQTARLTLALGDHTKNRTHHKRRRITHRVHNELSQEARCLWTTFAGKRLEPWVYIVLKRT